MAATVVGMRVRSAAWAAVLAALLPGPAVAAPDTPDLAQAAAMVVAQTNRFRRDEGLATTAADAQLTAAAQAFAQHMARTDRYSHQADGREPWQRTQAQGYTHCMVAENIAYQYSSEGFASAALAQALFSGWQQSPGHRHNMLAPEATDTGVALAQSAQTGRYYAVQLFGRPERLRLQFQISNNTPQMVNYDIDGQRFDLLPDVTRTHEQCIANALALRLPGEVAAGTVQPADGAHYKVTRAQGSVRLVRDGAA